VLDLGHNAPHRVPIRGFGAVFVEVLRWSVLMKIASVLTVAALLAAVSSASAQTVRVEGSGERRSQLDAMQLKPFTSSIWGELSEWSGTPVTAEMTEGKVVLIVTWAGWYRPTHAAVRKAQALHTQLADKGLVVVGVHNPREFAEAAAAAGTLGVTFPYAADAKGKFREALKVDQDPDFYLIDRAGQLRFADIETESVDAAAKQLLAETAEAAGKTLEGNATRDAAAQRESSRIRDISGRVRPGEAPTVAFELPDAEVYNAVKWPRMNKSGGSSPGATAYDQIVDRINKTPPVVALPEEGWSPSLPNTKGKLTILYIVDPGWRDMMNIITPMNRIQDVFERDAVVIANVARYEQQQNAEQTPREVAEAMARLQRIIQSIHQNRQLNHNTLTAPIPGDLFTNNVLPVFGRSIDEIAVTLILSSDGVLRWVGHPTTDTFASTVENLIKLDPGVQVRRKAEDAAAKSLR